MSLGIAPFRGTNHIERKNILLGVANKKRCRRKQTSKKEDPPTSADERASKFLARACVRINLIAGYYRMCHRLLNLVKHTECGHNTFLGDSLIDCRSAYCIHSTVHPSTCHSTSKPCTCRRYYGYVKSCLSCVNFLRSSFAPLYPIANLNASSHTKSVPGSSI